MARPRGISDEELLQVAREAFLEHGPQVSTEHIAEGAGVSQALLFQRFGTKEALMMASLAPASPPPFLADIAAGPDQRSLEAQLSSIIQMAMEFLQGLIPGIMVLHAAGVDFRQFLGRFDVPPPRAAIEEIAAWIQRAQCMGLVGDCDPEAAAFLITGSMHARIFLSEVLGQPIEGEDQAFRQELVRLWTRALAVTTSEEEA